MASNSENPSKKPGKPRFDIFEFPRGEKGERVPSGITYTRKPSLKDLPPDLQKEVTGRRLSLQEAWTQHFDEMDDAYSTPLSETLKSKIAELVATIENQSEEAKIIFDTLTEKEKDGFINAITLHVSMGKNIKEEKTDGQLSFSEVKESLDMMLRFNRNFLNGIYNLEQLCQEARRLKEDAAKKELARKYARDLSIFSEANTSDVDEIDFENATIGNQSLEQRLLAIFLENAPKKWHEVFINNSSINENEKALILEKIREYQSADNSRTDRVNPRHTGEITDSFLAILNPGKGVEKIGSSFLFEGSKYQIFELFTRKQLKLESDELRHCVGNSDTYFHAIREGRRRLFSIRSSDGDAKYTIAYEQKEHSISQFRGEDNKSVDPRSSASEFLLRVLNILDEAGVEISAIREDLNYGVAKVNGTIIEVENFTTNDALAFLKERGTNRIIKSEVLRIGSEMSPSDLSLLVEAGGLALDLTGLDAETKNGIEYVKGDLIDHSPSARYENLRLVGGNANLINLIDASGLSTLQEIGGNASFINLETSNGLGSLRSIGGNANFLNLVEGSDLKNLEEIGGNANFNSLSGSLGLSNLRDVGGYANFLNLLDASYLTRLITIGGNADFPNLMSAKGLESLKRIGGNANFINLRDSEGLNGLGEVGGNGLFINLENVTHFTNLKVVKGNANFNRLKNVNGLENLARIGRNANFLSLVEASGFLRLAEIGGNADFPTLPSSKGLENLSKIGGNANFASLRDSDNLTRLSYIGRHAFFFALSEADRNSVKALRGE